MKVFTDVAADYPAVKIFAIGAVDTARQVIQYDPEMRIRVADICTGRRHQLTGRHSE
jgi:hypothetical protein